MAKRSKAGSEDGGLFFDDYTTFALNRKINKRTVVFLPVGSIEEHGNHLPLSTDSLQAEYVSLEAARKLRPNALVLPSIRYGICTSTRNFCGTISISFETFHALMRDVLLELVRFNVKNVVVLSGHAGRLHMAAIRLAAEEMTEDYDIKIMVLSDYDIAYDLHDNDIPKDDGHAGYIETSRILHIRPDLVSGKGERMMPDFPKYLILKNPEKYFPTGIMGDPKGASAEKGKSMNDRIIGELVKTIKKNFEL